MSVFATPIVNYSVKNAIIKEKIIVKKSKQMPQMYYEFGPMLLIIMAWSLIWKGLALWRSARLGQKKMVYCLTYYKYSRYFRDNISLLYNEAGQ